MLMVRQVSALALVGAVLGLFFVSSAKHVRAAEPDAAKLIVVKAEYGDLPDGKVADVTEKVKALVNDNSLNVEASTHTFGIPAEKALKKLKVAYTIDGIYRSKTVNEGETLDISTRLVIRKAVYGDLPSGPSADVTDDVAELVRKNSLTVDATNERFGDTASGRVKKLRVDYTLDGVSKSQTVAENATMRIAAGDQPKK
jgi:hypothetical protein